MKNGQDQNFSTSIIEGSHAFDESTFGSNDENLPEGIRLKRTLKGMADHMFYGLQKSIKDRPNSKRAKMGFKITKNWILEKLKMGFCEVTGLPFDIRGDN